jgi:DNA-binding NarL/FixJ family response regulator
VSDAVRVVLADDHPMFREGLRFTLEREPGVSVVGEAPTGTEAGVRTRVLVLTMSEDDDTVFAALRAGAGGYLVKGADPGQVVSAVRAVARGHAVFGPHLAERMLTFFSGPAVRDAAGFPDLSAREQEVLTLLAEGQSNAEIGRALFISPITVRNHVSSILAKLQVTNRRQAMLRVRATQEPRRP